MAVLVIVLAWPAVVAWHHRRETAHLKRQDAAAARLQRRIDALEAMVRHSIGGPDAGGTRESWRAAKARQKPLKKRTAGRFFE